MHCLNKGSPTGCWGNQTGLWNAPLDVICYSTRGMATMTSRWVWFPSDITGHPLCLLPLAVRKEWFRIEVRNVTNVVNFWMTASHIVTQNLWGQEDHERPGVGYHMVFIAEMHRSTITHMIWDLNLHRARGDVFTLFTATGSHPGIQRTIVTFLTSVITVSRAADCEVWASFSSSAKDTCKHDCTPIDTCQSSWLISATGIFNGRHVHIS